MRSSAAAIVMSLEPWPSARSKRRPRAHRVSASDRSAEPARLGADPAAAVAPDRGVRDPEPLEHSSSVWAKSRAVTSTSWPRARRLAITGRITSTWGEFVRSTQILILRCG